MIGFVIVFSLLVIVTLFIQLITKMKIVGADELAIVAGQGRGSRRCAVGRVFVFPLIHRFFRMDMRPLTTSYGWSRQLPPASCPSPWWPRSACGRFLR